MQRAVVGAGLMVALLCSGCATIVSDSRYLVIINSNPDGANVTVQDMHGHVVYAATTPAAVQLPAAAGFFDAARYEFTFKKEGFRDARTSLLAGLDPWYFGNLIFGGLWGLVLIDPLTGAMWQLDESVFGNLSPNPE